MLSSRECTLRHVKADFMEVSDNNDFGNPETHVFVYGNKKCFEGMKMR